MLWICNHNTQISSDMYRQAVFNRAGVKLMAWGGTLSSKELQLEFRGMVDENPRLGTKEQDSSCPRKEEAPKAAPRWAICQKWILTPDYGSWIVPHCSLARLINNYQLKFSSLSTSWTRMSYKPHCKARERHRVPGFNVNWGGTIKNWGCLSFRDVPSEQGSENSDSVSDPCLN